MSEKVRKVVWTRQARESLTGILEYRYAEIPLAYKIVRSDIIQASKNVVFSQQFQKDDIFPEYRRIIVRDYKILYKEIDAVVYVLNVVCSKADS